MKQEMREKLEQGAEILERALVAYARGDATLDYVVDSTGGYVCLRHGEELLLTVCIPPIPVAGLTRGH